LSDFTELPVHGPDRLLTSSRFSVTHDETPNRRGAPAVNSRALSFASGETATPLITETIGTHFTGVAARFPEREALVSRHQQIRLTYRELARQSHGLASALLRLGLGRVDRVGI
jgi:non-ribosomal peptide synthetase component F